jgi:hypothetical protein
MICGAARLRTTSIPDYAALLDVARRRRAELNISYETLDALSGVQPGYSVKILGPNPSRCFGPVSLGCILSAMALRITIAVDRDAAERMAHRWTPRRFSVPISGAAAVAGESVPAAGPEMRGRMGGLAVGLFAFATVCGGSCEARRRFLSVWRVRRAAARDRCAAA